MLADGIRASVLFPTLPRFAGTLFRTFEDKELADACVRAYNDFMHRRVVPGGPRACSCRRSSASSGTAARRRRRSVGAPSGGHRALSFPENTVPLGLPSYWTDHWDPIWRACEERDIVMCLHIGTSSVAADAVARRAGRGRDVLACCRSARSWPRST